MERPTTGLWRAVRNQKDMRWQDHIESTPDVLRGKPRIKGTRIPVSLVLGYLAAGSTSEQVVAEFPDLTKQDVAACLSYTGKRG